jgi:hypothetical protein
MKLNVRVAGICASGAFIVTALPSFFTQWKQDTQPSNDAFSGYDLVETLMFCILGAILAAMIGFVIGNVLSRPAGKKKKRQAQASSPSSATSESQIPPSSAQLEESLLNDMKPTIDEKEEEAEEKTP